MTKQTTPHTQTQQNTKPEQTDFEMDESLSGAADNIYTKMEGAETGSNRSPRKLQTVARRTRRNTEPEIVGHLLCLGASQGMEEGTAAQSVGLKTTPRAAVPFSNQPPVLRLAREIASDEPWTVDFLGRADERY